MSLPSRRPGWERTGSRAVGEPRLNIPVDEFERVCQIHPTQAEIAAYFGVAVNTIRSRLTEEPYREAWQRGRAKGKIGLRKLVWDQAANGSSVMQRYLGEKHLFAKPQPARPIGSAQTQAAPIQQDADDMLDPAEVARAYIPTSEQRDDIDKSLDEEY